MRILISGASGLVGTALAAGLVERGDEVVRLVRPGRVATGAAIAWDPARGQLAGRQLEGFDCIVHLGGESIGGGLWTAKRKRRILASRVDSTQLLAEQLAHLKRPPAVFLCASGVGYYGDRGTSMADESCPSGAGFLAAVCRAWEAAAAPARSRGIRVVHMRFGVVLSGLGGALVSMLPAFRLGFGGPMGNGRQYMSWIGLSDSVGTLMHVLEDGEIHGPVNAVSPTPVTNEEFARTLGRVLRRPARLRLPAFALRLGLGQMGRELLLFSTGAVPAKLLATGYKFATPNLVDALHAALDAGRG